MNNYELNKLKRSVVAKSWLAEKLRICNGEGTRDWAIIHQQNILNYNLVIGYVGQFLTDDKDESKMKVQFVEMSIEYLFAHSLEKGGKKNGYINPDTCLITPSINVPIVKLSNPSYLGYFETHRNLFIGQDIGYGLKVSASREKSKIDIDTYKKRFGINNKNYQTNLADNDLIQQRMIKFGF